MHTYTLFFSLALKCIYMYMTIEVVIISLETLTRTF